MKDLLRWFLIVKLEPLWKRSSLAFVRFIAYFIGFVQYLLYPKARRVIRKHFKEELKLTSFRRELTVFFSIYHHLCNDIELIKYPLIDESFVRQHISISGPGWRYLQSNFNKSVILLTFHFGPNQIVIPTIPALGFKYTQLAVPPSYWDNLVKGGSLVKAVNKRRTQNLENTRSSFIYVSEGTGAQSEIFRAVKRGEVICFAIDGRIGELKTFPFLGGNIDIALGGFKLAKKLNLPIIITVSIRRNTVYSIEMQEPFFVNRKNMDDMVQNCILTLEMYVRRYPEQYGWMYYAKAIGG